jgi:hypothetical protein
LHLVTADDLLRLRPLLQPVLDAELARHSQYAPKLRDVDLRPVLRYARRVLAEPLSGGQLRDALAPEFPDLDPAALAYACRNRLPLVQVPPRGLWHRSGAVRTTTAQAWLGRDLEHRPRLDDLVLRYFAAFGPASVADVANWSRLTGLREVVERVRPQLRAFRDERGRELFDLPDAPRPSPEVPAPVRFLPEYDNVLLGHADRNRFVGDDERRRLAQARDFRGTVLVDGRVAAVWSVARAARAPDGAAVLQVEHAGIPRTAQREVAAEGERLLRFHTGDTVDHDVRLLALGG